MTAAELVAELRRGPATSAALAAEYGITRNAVSCAVDRANAEGYQIVNVRGGSRIALYALMAEADAPRFCAAPGCRTRLSHSNRTRWCRRHLPGVALALAVEAMLAEAEEVGDEQLAICG